MELYSEPTPIPYRTCDYHTCKRKAADVLFSPHACSAGRVLRVVCIYVAMRLVATCRVGLLVCMSFDEQACRSLSPMHALLLLGLALWLLLIAPIFATIRVDPN